MCMGYFNELSFALIQEENKVTMSEDIVKLKDEANEFFKSGDYEKAIDLCNKVKSCICQKLRWNLYGCNMKCLLITIGLCRLCPCAKTTI